MTTIDDKILVMCCMCEKVKISENPEQWIGKDNDKEKYDKLVKENKISHGYCLPCAEDYARKLGI